MWRFLTHAGLFFIPLVLVFAPAALMLYASGEFVSLRQVESIQLSQQALYNGAYSNFVYKLKQELTIAKKPAVLALGNSHVGQFSAAFFKNPVDFYNASGGAGAVSDFGYFIDSLGSWHPNILIMNTDIALFDETQSQDLITRPNLFVHDISASDVISESLIRNQGWWKVYRDWYLDKFNLREVFTDHTTIPTIGLYARANDSGYLSDGSTYYGDIISNPAEQEQKTAQSIHDLANAVSDTNGYAYGSTINPQALVALGNFLATCKAKGIFVIGFIPPVPHEVYIQLAAHPNATYHNTFVTLAPTLKALYAKYGFDFYDFSDIASLGSTDSEMVDPYHGSEVMYVRMMIRMATQNKLLGQYVDVGHLRTALTHATTPYSLFGLGTTTAQWR